MNPQDIQNFLYVIQCHRMNEQRASIPYLPGFLPHKQTNMTTLQKQPDLLDDSFDEMLMKSQVKI